MTNTHALEVCVGSYRAGLALGGTCARRVPKFVMLSEINFFLPQVVCVCVYTQGFTVTRYPQDPFPGERWRDC